VGLVLAFVLALLSPLASPWPDGLERVAENTGFLARAQNPFYDLLTDYTIPGVTNEVVSTILAGIVGTALLFAVGYGMARLLARRQPVQQA